MDSRTKKEKIKSHLERGYSITQRDAISLYNAYRLSAVIWDLVHYDNMNIKNLRKSGHAKYKLVPDGELAL
tara:strand:- start:928 stop:1140 length:213 start_codon:yes stop_codon:yes gene_type:complete